MLNQILSPYYKFRHSHKRYREIGLSGLPSSGKTTLIHMLKYGEVIADAMPTLGELFSITELEIPSSQGTSRYRYRITETGSQGCDPDGMRTLMKYLLAQSAAIVWMVDSCNMERLSESVLELLYVIDEHDLPRGLRDPLPAAAPILILATKQDRPDAFPLENIQIVFAEVTSTRSAAAVFGVSLITSEGQSSGILSAFDWLTDALQNASAPGSVRNSGRSISSASASVGPGPKPNSGSTVVLPPGLESPEQKLAAWVTSTETDSSPEEFLSQFHSISPWDHYTHIRLAYVILTTFGRTKGLDMIFSGIEKYITQSSQTRGRTFHATMTYFWIQMVHFGIYSVLLPPLDPDRYPSLSEMTGVGTEEDETPDAHSLNSFPASTQTDPDSTSNTSTLFPNTQEFPSEPSSSNSSFARFLLSNPHLTQGNLWEEFYSKDVIMTPQAKDNLVFPDRKPLPNYFVLPEKESFTITSSKAN